MKLLIVLLLWFVLLVLWWPGAILALILFPVVWLLSIPFRIIGITAHAFLALIAALLLLPARLLGYRRAR